MTWSQFITFYAANRNHVPHSVAVVIKREAVERLQERQQTGRGDSMLCFRDLVERMERSLSK